LRSGLERGPVVRRRPAILVLPRRVAPVALRRVAVDQRPRIERMPHAAHLVLDAEEDAPAFDVDDVLEAILVLVALLADQAALGEPAIGPGEIGEVDLHVVAVIARRRPIRLAEEEILVLADGDARRPAGAILLDRGRRPEALAVEARDGGGDAGGDLELDIGH